MGVDEGRPLARAAPLDGAATRGVRGERVAAVALLEVEVWEGLHESRDAAARGLHLDRDRDRVAVVLHEEEDGQLQVARGVQRLPELALARRPVADGYVDDFILLEELCPAPELGDELEAVAGLGAADRLQELGPRGARLGDDVVLGVAPVRGHLPAAARGVVSGGDPLEQHLVGGDAEPQAERAVPVVGVEPVVAGLEVEGRADENGLVARAADLEEDTGSAA